MGLSVGNLPVGHSLTLKVAQIADAQDEKCCQERQAQ